VTVRRVDRAERATLQRHLIELADGNREAFHPAFVTLWPLVRAFVGRHLPGPNADDVAQEALLKVFVRAGEFDPSRDGLAWVLGIALWEVRTARTKHRRRREGPFEPGAVEARPDERPTPEDLAIAHDLELALGCALGALPPRDAETLSSFARGERPAVPASTFRKRVERSLARARQIWRATHGPRE
jgi:RNA polymerase sigma-70 factor (ECF subfamily)